MDVGIVILLQVCPESVLRKTAGVLWMLANTVPVCDGCAAIAELASTASDVAALARPMVAIAVQVLPPSVLLNTPTGVAAYTIDDADRAAAIALTTRLAPSDGKLQFFPAFAVTS